MNDISFCIGKDNNEKFIGPIKKNDNLFFVSFASQSNLINIF